jgi:tRNA isopentenyl-2-thiomethyl-A-37 hydroxylase MiaE
VPFIIVINKIECTANKQAYLKELKALLERKLLRMILLDKNSVNQRATYTNINLLVPVLLASCHTYYGLDVLKKYLFNLPNNKALTQCVLKPVSNLYQAERSPDFHDQAIHTEVLLLTNYHLSEAKNGANAAGGKRKMQEKLILGGTVTKGTLAVG